MELGIKVRDKVTGFVGVVTAFTQYMTGCNQALVQPTDLGKDGAYPDCHWFDVQRLERVGTTQVILDNGATPGFGPPAPKR